MNTQYPARIWIAAAGDGIGHALALHLLERGCQLAVTGNLSTEQRNVLDSYGEQLHVAQVDVLSATQVARFSDELSQRWGGLDALIINAGGTDYLLPEQLDGQVFEHMTHSHLAASANCLKVAAPLLQGSAMPWVLALVSTYTASQLFEPSQPATANNSVLKVFENARRPLAEHGIALTVVAPQPLPQMNKAQIALPEVWSAEAAAEVIMAHMDQRPKALTLATQAPHLLWPLPRRS